MSTPATLPCDHAAPHLAAWVGVHQPHLHHHVGWLLLLACIIFKYPSVMESVRNMALRVPNITPTLVVPHACTRWHRSAVRARCQVRVQPYPRRSLATGVAAGLGVGQRLGGGNGIMHTHQTLHKRYCNCALQLCNLAMATMIESPRFGVGAVSNRHARAYVPCVCSAARMRGGCGI